MKKIGPGDDPRDLHLADDDDEDLYNGETLWAINEYGVDLEQGEIYLFGFEGYTIGVGTLEDEQFSEPGVDFTMANRFIRGLRTLHLAMEPGETILVHLNTCGGCWQHGMAIYQAIKWCPNPVAVINYAEARSMSSIIPLAADRFVMMPDDSRYMIHRGTWGFDGTGTQADTEYHQLKRSESRMLDIYAEAMKQGSKRRWGTKRKREWLTAQMKEHEEVYWDPAETVDLGFAHAVFDGDWDALCDPSAWK